MEYFEPLSPENTGNAEVEANFMENNLSDRIQVQICSDVDAVINDSSDPVNIEKESNQKEKYFPVRNCDFFQGSEYFSKCLTDGNRSHFHVILLPILLQQRQRSPGLYKRDAFLSVMLLRSKSP